MARDKPDCEQFSRAELNVLAALLKKAHSDCLKKYKGDNKEAAVLNYWAILLEKVRMLAK